MNTIEDRLREAFRTDAETVRPETVRPFARPGTERPRPVLRPRGRIMVPIAAGTAVAVIAVGTAVVLPRILASRDRHIPPSGLAAGYPDGRMPTGPPPKFFVAITYGRSGSPTATDLSVINATTGQVTGQLAPPAPHQAFQAVAPLGNNRTFVAEARGIRCDAWFYRFTLTARGKPSDLTPLAVPMVPGRPLSPPSLATGLSGQIIAFVTNKCASTSYRNYYGQVGVINLITRKATTWRFKWPAIPTSLSLTSAGRLLELVSNPSTGTSESSPEFNAAWVVRTNSASGPLAARYRRVFGAPTWPTAAVLSPNGRLTWALEPSYLHTQPRIRVTLDVYQTATGRLIRALHIFPRQSYFMDPSLSPDPSGRYLLVYQFNNLVEKLDLATGRLTKVPGNAAYLPLDVAW